MPSRVPAAPRPLLTMGWRRGTRSRPEPNGARRRIALSSTSRAVLQAWPIASAVVRVASHAAAGSAVGPVIPSGPPPPSCGVKGHRGPLTNLSSASASATRVRMPARSLSRPVETALVALDTEVSCILSARIASSCSRTPARARPIRCRVDLDVPLLELRDGEQPGGPDGRLEDSAPSGASGSADDVDVVPDERERGDARSARAPASRRRSPRRHCGSRAPRAAPPASRAATSRGPWPR